MIQTSTHTLLINMVHCEIQSHSSIIIPNLSWALHANEAWLIIGPNGSGKSALAAGLANKLDIIPLPTGSYINFLSSSVALISFEEASALIEEERRNDDSDFIEGGIDSGRSVREFLVEKLPGLANSTFQHNDNLDQHPLVSRCGITSLLDRGLKYLSTGEIRRSLLCRALLQETRLLIIDEPFDGLDTTSRKTVFDLLEELAQANSSGAAPSLIILMDRYQAIPPSISHVLELGEQTVQFAGSKALYEKTRVRHSESNNGHKKPESYIIETLDSINKHTQTLLPSMHIKNKELLIEMKNVIVEWSGTRIINDLSWTIRAGEHWLLRGPNGSGKTTLLELITGDNPQVFSNDISLFGNRRGSGETIWELKEKMGIVSYRLHLNYRAYGNLTLEEVVLSGIHDSIGLYQSSSHEQSHLAREWLQLGSFQGREQEHFGNLSYGEQRAVLIIRAAVKCPPLLILDEPCHGLDDQHRTLILQLLEAIAGRGISTLLHVTHDPAEVLTCTTHVLELQPTRTPMYSITRL